MSNSTIWAPKGEPGDKGPDGNPGPQGPPGPTGGPGPDAATFVQFVNDLANPTDPTKGAALVGFNGTTLATFLQTLVGSGSGKVVTSIADIRTSQTSGANTFFTMCYLTPGDRGFATYDVDLLDTTSADNGGTIIVTASGQRAKLRKAGINLRPSQFGAKGDNTADDTAAIQACLNASKNVEWDDGQYKLTGGLTAQPGSKLLARNFEAVRLSRSGVWAGPTLSIGSIASSSGAFEVTGLLFEQIHPGFTGGVDTPIVDRLTGGQPHIQVYGGTGGKISRCWFQWAVYGVDILGGNQIKVEDCFFNGVYDAQVATRQESIAAIRVRNHPTLGYATLIKLHGNNVSGVFSPDRTISNGANTYLSHQDCGYQFSILIQGCEGVEIKGGYLGVNNKNSIKIAGNAASSPALIQNVEITGVFFDGCTEYSVYVGSEDGTVATIIDVHDNRFNGQLVTHGVLQVDAPAGAKTCKILKFDGNISQGHNRCPLYLVGLGSGRIRNNEIIGYNARNGGGAAQSNPSFQAGMFVGDQSSDVRSSNNFWGGGTNDPETNGNASWGGYFAVSTRCSTSNERGLMSDGTGVRIGGIAQTYPT